MTDKQLSQADINFFTALLGEKYVITNQSDVAPFTEEPRHLFKNTCPCVLKPQNTEQISKIMDYANKQKLAIVPQGGNTGLVGGQVPAHDNEIILSLSRLNGDIEVSKSTQSLSCSSGNTLLQIQQAAAEAGLYFPLSLGSEGSCQIGGNISTNAGGTGVLKYGNMRDLVLGLEVVLADGEIWNGLRTLRKNNTGYDLKHLFIGGEGTLGIITKATLKLFTKPNHITTAFCAIDCPQKAVDLLSMMQKLSNNQIHAFELISQVAIDLVAKHSQNSRFALDEKSPWYILLDMGTDINGLTDILEQAFNAELITNAAIAQNETQAKEFWYPRHIIPEMQTMEGGSIKHDISVPIANIPDFIKSGTAIVQAIVPNCRPVTFGHIGDGNLHYNVSQPVNMDKQEYLSYWAEMNAAVNQLVMSYDGSFSAEHGIGQLKVQTMSDYKSKIELKMMRQIKQQFDPNNILNPNKTVPLL